MVLEKIGLPAKPSMRGSNWVVDASHCQGCSSQFTFINRKHHCRRCGGLFCGSCTQQRMILRGQGDSPVRICDPCKKLEEAARFELRHGHKTRNIRGGSKVNAKNEEEVLNQILGTDIKQSSVSRSDTSSSNAVFDFDKGTNNASSSNLGEEAATSAETQNSTTEDIGSRSPEELLQLSLEEKKKYRVLKGEGKPEEALRAFKRGKELEREAKSLELALRKTSRKALSSKSLADKRTEESEGFLAKSKFSHNAREEKNDLASELKELGWSDADLHDADKEPKKMSLEGELSTLLGEVHKKTGIGKGTGIIDKTQVITLKKKALALKKEGKLAEAKEELKKAKVLEKQLEEQEFLAEAEDSDDELSALIRSMGDDKQADVSLMDRQEAGFDFRHLMGVSDDLGLDGNFDVTEEDMEDPEIAAALESLGWTEDSESPEVSSQQSAHVDRKQLLDEVLVLKKEAVRQKRSGNVQEAMVLLRKAKLLEKDAEILHSMETKHTSGKELTSQTAGGKGEDELVGTSTYAASKSQTKSKLMIQRELLGIKKRALTLRREGRVDEAEEELRKGKILESQLEEMESGSRVNNTKVSGSSRTSNAVHKQPGMSEVVGLGEEDDEAEVSEHDMQDPAMLQMLESLGWKDEESEVLSARHSNLLDSHPEADRLQSTEVAFMAQKRSKAEIQKELLGLKRKALTLRRQGEFKEAEEMLNKAKLLEAQLEEIELPKKEPLPNLDSNTQEAPVAIYTFGERQTTKPLAKNLENVPRHDMLAQPPSSSLESVGDINEPVNSVNKRRIPFGNPSVAVRNKAEIQRELLALKRKALTLRRQGENEEAEEVLKMAKVLEEQLEEMTVPKGKEPDVGILISKEKPGLSRAVEESTTIPKVSHSSENTMPLVELDPPNLSDVVEHAGSFPHAGQSANLVDLLSGDHWQSSQKTVKEVDNSANISTLDYLNAHSGTTKSEDSKKHVSRSDKEPVPETDSKPLLDSPSSPGDLRHQILTRKKKAVALKREGKLAEAREELRQAKFLERSLQEEKPQTDELVSISNESSPVQEERKPTKQEPPKQMTSRDRFKLQQESLSHKRQALKLRREGKMAEAEAEFELAKALETQLEESSGNDLSGKKNAETEGMDDLGVEDLLDPQLLSALKALGIQDAAPQTPHRPESSKSNISKIDTSNQEKSQMEELIKAEKVKAVNLKRAGKQAEAMDALRRAKMYEKKLSTLA